MTSTTTTTTTATTTTTRKMLKREILVLICEFEKTKVSTFSLKFFVEIISFYFFAVIFQLKENTFRYQ